MAIELVGVATGTGTGSSYTISLTALSGGIGSQPLPGDLVLVTTGFGSTIQFAIGITGNNSGQYLFAHNSLYVNDTYDTNHRVGYLVQGDVVDTSVTVTKVSSSAYGGATVVSVWRGVDPSSPLDVVATTATSGNASRPNPPAITPVTPGAIILAAGTGVQGTSTGSVFTVPSGMTPVASILGNGSSADVGVFVSSIEWSSGSYDPPQATGGYTSTSSSWAASTIALRPYVIYEGVELGDAQEAVDASVSRDVSISEDSVLEGVFSAGLLVLGDVLSVTEAVVDQDGFPFSFSYADELAQPDDQSVTLSTLIGETHESTVGWGSGGATWYSESWSSSSPVETIDAGILRESAQYDLADAAESSSRLAAYTVSIDAAAAPVDVVSAVFSSDLSLFEISAGIDGQSASTVATAFQAELTSGGDSAGAVFVVNRSVVESVSAVDALTRQVSFVSARVEPIIAADTVSAVFSVLVFGSDAALMDSAQSSVKTTLGAVPEVVSAGDSRAASKVTISSRSEPASGVDNAAASGVVFVFSTNTASPSDLSSRSVATLRASSEVAASIDSAAAVKTTASVRGENSAASDSVTSSALIYSAVAAAATPSDAAAASSVIVADTLSTASVSDASVGGLVISVSTDSVVTAGSDADSDLIYMTMTLSEVVSAADALTADGLLFAVSGEQVFASTSAQSSTISVSWMHESVDSTDGQPSAITAVMSLSAETAFLTDGTGAQLVAHADAVAHAMMVDAQYSATEAMAVADEIVYADSVPVGRIGIPAFSSEAAVTVSVSEASSVLTSVIGEAALATDNASSLFVVGATVSAVISALESASAVMIGEASVLDGCYAEDLPTGARLVFSSAESAGLAFDLLSASSVIIVESEHGAMPAESSDSAQASSAALSEYVLAMDSSEYSFVSATDVFENGLAADFSVIIDPDSGRWVGVIAPSGREYSVSSMSRDGVIVERYRSTGVSAGRRDFILIGKRIFRA